MQTSHAPQEPNSKGTKNFGSGGLGSLPASAEVHRADNGAAVSLKALLHSGERPPVWSLNERMRHIPRPLADVFACGQAEVTEVRLASGRLIEVASGSRMLTIDGWRRRDELAVDDRIAIPRWIPAPLATDEMPDPEVILLAHMIGDGSCVKRQPIRYASIDEENLSAVATAATHFGITAIRDEYAAARVTTLRLPAPYRLTHGRRNPVAAWLDGLGLFGLRSYEKFIPERVFALPTAQVAIFLRHLWATDGSIRWDARGHQARIYYASTSWRLICDVANLLLRLEVHGRIKRVRKPGYRDCFHLTIDGVDNQSTFLCDIGAHGARGIAGEAALAHLNTMDSNPNVDTIPKEIRIRIKSLLEARGMTHREFQAAMSSRYSGSNFWKYSPSRWRLSRAADILGAPELAAFCNNDLFWDRITAITDLGRQDVFAAYVPGTENLVAQGVSVYAGR
ncbi:LAGLIDADG family homing endonuclease [Nocardia tengchongensis]|uniref:LAGLIDADG family homing endonuclease n=1 Tax=Nocardia tengchongensis TaxID=2055889 RepID=UPI001FE4B63A|nr:LAGLIDADG family homing endonuclease [Nocardia tengchongensis]